VLAALPKFTAANGMANNKTNPHDGDHVSLL
jgi:hypothetical protein